MKVPGYFILLLAIHCIGVTARLVEESSVTSTVTRWRGGTNEGSVDEKVPAEPEAGADTKPEVKMEVKLDIAFMVVNEIYLHVRRMDRLLATMQGRTMIEYLNPKLFPRAISRLEELFDGFVPSMLQRTLSTMKPGSEMKYLKTSIAYRFIFARVALMLWLYHITLWFYPHFLS